jgi:hypothetical protein
MAESDAFSPFGEDTGIYRGNRRPSEAETKRQNRCQTYYVGRLLFWPHFGFGRREPYELGSNRNAEVSGKWPKG